MSDGILSQCAEKIGQLMSDMMLSKRLAVLMCQAHKKEIELKHHWDEIISTTSWPLQTLYEASKRGQKKKKKEA